MKTKGTRLVLVLIITIISATLQLNAQSKKVPGVVVNYVPASTKTYIGSPSICILPTGDYIASHDFFGPASTEDQQGLTAIFKSSDKGKSWKKISEINGQFWSNIFVHQNKLYIMGTWKHNGNLIIRCSLDGGVTWSEPTDAESGLLLEGEYHTAPMPVIIYKDRLWRAIENAKPDTKAWGKRFSAMVVSAPINSDLLNAASWRGTNFITYDSTYLEDKFGEWIEGNAVVTPEGNLVDILRVSNLGKGSEVAAFVKISDDGLTASFDPSTGYVDFSGGAKKFSIRYDEKSNRYWTLVNMVDEQFSDMNPASVRNKLILKSSSDLKNWMLNKVLLQHPDVEKHGFQYVDWQFDGKDIIYLSRTAYDDEFGGAHNFHDANYLTFHRIKNFRKLVKD